MLEVLADEGYVYDSSVCPIGRGFASQPWRRYVHQNEINDRSIWEVPPSTSKMLGCSVPGFADVDPHTYNVTAQTIEARLTSKTKAIIVTHLFGNPCDMNEIMEPANHHNIPVIEDCAQAFLTSYDDHYVGTIGCFSLQQGKHITTGEGGVVVSDHEEYACRMFLFINKAWGYGDAQPDHYFLALNYRMSELQGAVALAQLSKLDGVVESRVRTADALTSALQGLPGIETPQVTNGGVHTYWKYCLRIDENAIVDGAVGLGGKLREKDIACAPRYIQKPAFKCQVFSEQVTLGSSHWPFNLAQPSAVDYSDELFEGTSYISIYGSRGTVLVGWKESKYGRSNDDEWISFGNGYNKFQAFRGQIENFARAIRGEDKMLVSPEDAIASVEVIEAAYASLKADQWQPVEH